MNTSDWTSVRDGILSKDGPVLPVCEQCYLMNDTYGSDV